MDKESTEVVGLMCHNHCFVLALGIEQRSWRTKLGLPLSVYNSLGCCTNGVVAPRSEPSGEAQSKRGSLVGGGWRLVPCS